MPDLSAKDCSQCARRSVRRSHAGVMVCPRCDLNELPTTPTPSVMPRRRPLARPEEESSHG